MNFQSFVDAVAMPCCVIAVQCRSDYTCGDIRIACSNQLYKDIMGPACKDGMLYYNLVPQDNKFENFCFRSAIFGERMHAYVETRALSTWTDQTLIPLCGTDPEPDGSFIGYCQFIFEFTETAEADRMASVSVTTAETVIQATIELMGGVNFLEGLGKSLDAILQFSDAKACRIMLIDHEKQKAITLCERAAEDSHPKVPVGGNYISYELMNTWEKIIGDSNCLIVQNETDMKRIEEANPEWAASMRNAGVHNMVLIPLRRGRQVIGYLYAVNFDEEKVVEIKELIELMSFYLGSEIYNYVLMDRLDEISRVDALTGLGNRRAMVEKMKMMREGTPFGVINFDLNGLKVVNDTYGHEAGDALLIKATEALHKMFYEEDIFRTGGDEFIVLSDGITEESFNRKLTRLRLSMEKNDDVSFSMGGFWSDGSVDLNQAFRKADEAMYADKQAFYEKHPERRKR